MKDRHWHLITDDELAALLLERGCARVGHLVRERDTVQGDRDIEMALSRPVSGSQGPPLPSTPSRP